MARRIDIELTSARPDGTWTWRAAGAMQPRGVVDGTLLAAEARAGDVLRAEADFEIEGISIVSVLAPKQKKRTEPDRIELITAPAPAAGVTTQLVGRGRPSEGRRSSRDDGRGGGDRTGRPGGPGGERSGRDGPGSGRPGGRRTGGEGGTGPRPAADRAPADRAPSNRTPSDRPSSDRPASDRPSSDRGSAGRPASDRQSARRAAPGDRSPSARPAGERRRREGSGAGRPARAATSEQSEPVSRVAAGRRLNPGNAHRQAVMASLSPEHQPIAEQVLRGGIPAVRTAIHLEREKATAEGRPAPNADSLLVIAEELLPRLKAAEWRDRAEAAAKIADNLALRDLRSVVAGGDLARDDETRQLAASLREMLESRLTSMREEWVQEITTQMQEGRVVRALRLAARPPEATTRLSAEQAQQLTAAASAAMAPDTPPERWVALLEAVAASPVRRQVKPVGLPAEPGAALLTAAQQQVGRIPALAALLGISMPPPPGPTRAPGSRPAPPRRRPPGRSPTPPPPPAGAPGPAPSDDAPADEAPADEAPSDGAPADQAPAGAAPIEPVNVEPADVGPVSGDGAPAADGGSADIAAPELAAPESAVPEPAAPESAAPESAIFQETSPARPGDVAVTADPAPH